MTADAPHGTFLELARVKVHRLCGPQRGEEMLQSALAGAGLVDLATADDLRRLADHLVDAGGFAQAVGYALRFQATLHGAAPAPSRR